jgi:hypothetical protein
VRTGETTKKCGEELRRFPHPTVIQEDGRQAEAWMPARKKEERRTHGTTLIMTDFGFRGKELKMCIDVNPYCDGATQSLIQLSTFNPSHDLR